MRKGKGSTQKKITVFSTKSRGLHDAQRNGPFFITTGGNNGAPAAPTTQPGEPRSAPGELDSTPATRGRAPAVEEVVSGAAEAVQHAPAKEALGAAVGETSGGYACF